VYWTFQEILPKHCPDILERMRARVAAGQDEIVLGPFNNGANHAATEDEFRAAVTWAIENPWGSGLRQLFSKVTPFYRPQECVFTTGQEQILKECGVEGLILYYALVPFNTLGVLYRSIPWGSSPPHCQWKDVTIPSGSAHAKISRLWWYSQPCPPRMCWR